MKTIRAFMILAIAVLSSISLSAQEYTFKVIDGDGYRYQGEWPSGDGVLYSYQDGLVLGKFRRGKPHGECVCYLPNGTVYWGIFKKGKMTGHGRLYRDNGIVVSGGYKNGKYHGIDTLYRSNGTTMVGKFKKGKLVETLSDGQLGLKPRYPRVDLRARHEEFLKELELIWEERNMLLARKAGLVAPRFQGGDVDDFALWVNSQVVYPIRDRAERNSRTVIVEFTVLRDGSVADAHVIFGSDPVLNEQAVKAVMKSPKWTPAEQNGQTRSVRLSVPVVYDL